MDDIPSGKTGTRPHSVFEKSHTIECWTIQSDTTRYIKIDGVARGGIELHIDVRPAVVSMLNVVVTDTAGDPGLDHVVTTSSCGPPGVSSRRQHGAESEGHSKSKCREHLAKGDRALDRGVRMAHQHLRFVGKETVGARRLSVNVPLVAVAQLVEGWFHLLTQRRLRRGTFTSVDALIEAIELWAEHWNDDLHPFIWHKTTEEIITKVRRGRTALTEAKSATHH